MHQYCWLVGGSFLALQLVWITASCAPGFAFSWPRASCRQAGRWQTRFSPGQVVRVTRVVIGRSMWGPCLICGEADPTVSYTYAARKVVRLHAACNAFWRLERTAE